MLRWCGSANDRMVQTPLQACNSAPPCTLCIRPHATQPLLLPRCSCAAWSWAACAWPSSRPAWRRRSAASPTSPAPVSLLGVLKACCACCACALQSPRMPVGAAPCRCSLGRTVTGTPMPCPLSTRPRRPAGRAAAAAGGHHFVGGLAPPGLPARAAPGAPGWRRHALECVGMQHAARPDARVGCGGGMAHPAPAQIQCVPPPPLLPPA